MKVKKPISILLTLIMLLSIFTVVPVTANASEADDFWVYTVTDNGRHCVITGTTLSESQIENTYDIVIPGKINGLPVTEIRMSFSDFTNLHLLWFYSDIAITVMPSVRGCGTLNVIGVKNSETGKNTYHTLPDSITTIPSGTFSDTDIHTLTMPGVTEIGGSGDLPGAFEDCPFLDNIIIPQPAVIGRGSFKHSGVNGHSCTVTYNGPSSNWSPEDYRYSPGFRVDCTDGSKGWCGGADSSEHNLLCWDMDLSGNLCVHYIDDSLIQYPENQIIKVTGWDHSKVRTVSMPGAFSIGEYAFEDCTMLESISIPSTIHMIEKSAFACCTSLMNVEFLGNIRSLGDFAFYECTSLESIRLPSALVTIGISAFSGCTSLKSIEMPKSLMTLGYSVFKDCTLLGSIELPDTVTMIPSRMFAGCSSLETIRFSDRLEKIDDYAFQNCISLKAPSTAAPRSQKSFSPLLSKP